MTLEQVAQQAMDYLDSVGVAADYDITSYGLRVSTDDRIFNIIKSEGKLNQAIYLQAIKYRYPQKSPA